MNNPASPWRTPTKQQKVTAFSEEELDKRLKDKERDGYKVLNRGSFFSRAGVKKYVAVVEKV